MEHLRYLAAVILLLALNPGRTELYFYTQKELADAEVIVVASVVAVHPVAADPHFTDAILLVEDTLKGTVPGLFSGRFHPQRGPHETARHWHPATDICSSCAASMGSAG